ncbi:MAG: hypothetical protein ACR5KV_08180 [Wolbachia sp.]
MLDIITLNDILIKKQESRIRSENMIQDQNNVETLNRVNIDRSFAEQG